jgi:predicted transcriptional regulator
MPVLLSIRKEFSDAIYAGSKRFEFRRRVFDTLAHTETLIYTTSPVSRVTGRFTVQDLMVGDPQKVWEMTKQYAGIDEVRYMTYFSGVSVAFALLIGGVERFDRPLELEPHFGLTRPPQSYAFV